MKDENLAAELREAFLHRGMGHWDLAAYRSVSSTMDAAAEDVGDQRLAVFALEQTAGRGREGRSWTSGEGRGIYVTYRFTIAGAPNAAGLSLAAGLAVARTLGGFGIAARLKWPNDVLAGRGAALKKIAGVLVDLSTSPAGSKILVGIGLNLEPQELGEAVSIREIADAEVRYADTAAALTAEVDSTLSSFF